MIAFETLHGTVEQLRHAIDHHERWSRELSRTLACRLPPDPADLVDDAHVHCRFGRWYRGVHDPVLLAFPDFRAIEEAHRSVHHAATRLLEASVRARGFTLEDYDRFARALELMRRKLHAVIRDLESSLYDHDPLTGAENRTRMMSVLQDLHELARRHGTTSCISILDLDHFKEVNDSRGHPVGDRVLVEIVHRLRQELRQNDKIFRYGGEEFLIALPHTDLEAACAVLERARKGLEARGFQEDGASPIRMTASFGVTTIEARLPVRESLERADSALYEAKALGRNRIAVREPAVPASGQTFTAPQGQPPVASS